MGKLFLLLGFTLVFAGCQHLSKAPKPISIVSVAMSIRSEDSFKGIMEAFDHKESKGGRVFLRTHPNQRSGIYFSVKFRHAIGLLPQGSKIILHFITNASPKPESVTWIFNETGRSLALRNELYLGITDDEHYAVKNRLIAWHLEILHPDGHTIACKESLAW